MTGVVDAARDDRRSFVPGSSPCNRSSSPSSDNSTFGSSYYTPLLTPSNSSTSCSPPPLTNMLESPVSVSGQPTAFTTLIKPPSPECKDTADVKTEGEEDTSSWSMHLDVLSKLKTEGEDWYDSEEHSPEALISSSRSCKTEYLPTVNMTQDEQQQTPSPPNPSTFPHAEPYPHQHFTPPHTNFHHEHFGPPPHFNPPFQSPYFHHDYHHSSHHPIHLPHHQQHHSYSPPPPAFTPLNPQSSPYPLPHTPPGTPLAAPHTPPTPPASSQTSHLLLPKRRGRKPKHVKLEEDNGNYEGVAAAWAEHDARKRRKLEQSGQPVPSLTPPPPPPPADPPVKQRKKMDRFGGMEEEEVAKKTLPDHLKHGLDIVIIGINPGLFAAYKGHHYAGPGNHFWKCLYLSGLITEPYSAEDDHTLLDQGIGFTNIVPRTTRGSADLTRLEIKQGAEVLISKLRYYQPKVAVFNGKGIYEVFSGRKDFQFGKQPELFPHSNAYVWVMPSSSARCAQLPRALDKVPFYSALKKFLDYLHGRIDHINEEELTFAHVKLKNFKKEDKTLDTIEDDDAASQDSKEGILPPVVTPEGGVDAPAAEEAPPKAPSVPPARFGAVEGPPGRYGGVNPNYLSFPDKDCKEIKVEVNESVEGHSKYFPPYGAY